MTTLGYASFIGSLNVIAPTNLAHISTVSSFAGGLFTVTGVGQSSSSYIMVNGFRGDIRTYTSSSITFNLPPLITANSQEKFTLATTDKISQ